MSPRANSTDHSALRTNPAAIALLLATGFVADRPGLVGCTALFMAAGTLAVIARVRTARRNGRRLAFAGGASAEPVHVRHGVPAILYFSSPACAACRTTQRPALEKLLARWDGPLQVVEIDALQHPALADRWGVLTLPTTVVLDAAGIALRMHHGTATAEVLARSLREAGRRAAAPVARFG